MSNIENISKLTDEINSINLLNHLQNWSTEDYNNYLDYRDSEEFENKWLEAANKIQSYTTNVELPIERIVKIREITFKRTFNLTQNPDLAAYVSDDFELIAENFLFDQKNDFINNMWDTYKMGELPK